jgi:alkanesulfonate monooxygenase SsuD/methylene tetrahydromethanopterin reductase-like flavin-dependent oxidoreductase (luciferase family)
VRIGEKGLPGPGLHFVAGSPAEVAEELRGFVAVGANPIIIRFVDLASLKRFLDESLPALQA